MQHTRRAYVGIAMLCTICLPVMGCRPGRDSTQPPAMRGDHGVWLRISAKQPSSPYGAPVVITATFQNRTAEEMMLPPFDPWYVGASNIGDGAPAAMRFQSRTFVHVEPMPTDSEDGPPPPELSEGWVEIPPNSDRSYTIDLLEVGTCPWVLPTGEYTVWIDYWAANSWPGMPKEWHLISNAIRIRIVPPGSRPK